MREKKKFLQGVNIERMVSTVKTIHRIVTPMASFLMIMCVTTVLVYLTGKMVGKKFTYAILLHQGAFWGKKDIGRVFTCVIQALIFVATVFSGGIMFKINKNLTKAPTTMRQFHHRITMITCWWFMVIALTGAGYRVLGQLGVPKVYIKPLMYIHACNFHPNGPILYAGFIAFLIALVVFSGMAVYVPILKVKLRKTTRRVNMTFKGISTRLSSTTKFDDEEKPVIVIMDPENEVVPSYGSIVDTTMEPIMQSKEGEAVVIDVEDLCDHNTDDPCKVCNVDCESKAHCLHIR